MVNMTISFKEISPPAESRSRPWLLGVCFYIPVDVGKNRGPSTGYQVIFGVDFLVGRSTFSQNLFRIDLGELCLNEQFQRWFCWEMIIGVNQNFLNLYNNQKHPKRTRAGGKFVHLHFGSSLERNKQLELTWTESTFGRESKNIFDVREMFFVRFFLLPYISPKGGHSS